jgi:hypothetical protein
MDGWMAAHHLTGPGTEAFRAVETSGKSLPASSIYVHGHIAKKWVTTLERVAA